MVFACFWEDAKLSTANFSTAFNCFTLSLKKDVPIAINCGIFILGDAIPFRSITTSALIFFTMDGIFTRYIQFKKKAVLFSSEIKTMVLSSTFCCDAGTDLLQAL